MRKFITAHARENKPTARMLANARKDHSIPLLSCRALRAWTTTPFLKSVCVQGKNCRVGNYLNRCLHDDFSSLSMNYDYLYDYYNNLYFHLFQKLTGHELIYTEFLGKPYLTSYQYAEYCLNQNNGGVTGNIKSLYAVG